MAYPIQQKADGSVLYSDGSIRWSSNNDAIGTGTGGYAVYKDPEVLGASTSNVNSGNRGNSGDRGNSGNSGNTGVDWNSIINKQREAAKGIYNRRVSQGDEAYKLAEDIRNEGLGLLKQRRGEFQQNYTQGQNDILGRYSTERGNLQATAEGAQQRAGNALRAQGITGGSAGMNYQGRQNQENAKAYGQLQSQRDTNDRANTDEFNENNTWANTQESALQRQLQQAALQRQAIKDSAWAQYAGDNNQLDSQLGGYLQSMVDNQNAMRAAQQGIGNKVANPYEVNISDMTNSLNQVAPENGSILGANAQNQGVSIEANPTNDLYKKLMGLYGNTYSGGGSW